MKFAARELNLLGLTLGVIVLGLTYLWLEPKFQEWTEFRAEREELAARRDAAEHLLASRAEVEARLAEFRGGLPVYAVGVGGDGERQREMAYRFGVNLIMYVLTGNYKSDQIHVPELLERLRDEDQP